MNVGMFILGLILLIGGIIAFGYTVELKGDPNGLYFAPSETTYSRPYVALGVIVGLIGLLFMIFGAISPTVKTKTVTKGEVITTPKKRTVVHEEVE